MKLSDLNDLKVRSLRHFGLQVSQLVFNTESTPYVSQATLAQAVELARQSIKNLLANATTIEFTEVSERGFRKFKQAWFDHVHDLRLAIEERLFSSSRGNLDFLHGRFAEMRVWVEERLDLLAPPFTESRQAGGRPPKWRWEDALCHLVAVAGREGWTSAQRGNQTRIAEALAAWFQDNQFDEPAPSELQIRAKAIQSEIQALANSEN